MIKVFEGVDHELDTVGREKLVLFGVDLLRGKDESGDNFFLQFFQLPNQ
jgi:hypothetical protein